MQIHRKTPVLKSLFNKVAERKTDSKTGVLLWNLQIFWDGLACMVSTINLPWKIPATKYTPMSPLKCCRCSLRNTLIQCTFLTSCISFCSFTDNMTIYKKLFVSRILMTNRPSAQSFNICFWKQENWKNKLLEETLNKWFSTKQSLP